MLKISESNPKFFYYVYSWIWLPNLWYRIDNFNIYVKMDPIGKDTWNELLNFVTIYYHESDNFIMHVKEIGLFTNISSGDILNLTITTKTGGNQTPAVSWDFDKHYVLPDEELNVLKDYAGVPHRQKLIKVDCRFRRLYGFN